MKNLFKNISLMNAKTGLFLLGAGVAVLTGHNVDLASVSATLGTSSTHLTTGGLITDLFNTAANIYHMFV